MVAGYEDVKHIKEFMSLQELLNIRMKIGHLKRFLVALMRLDSCRDDNNITKAEVIGKNHKRFVIIDNIVNNVTAESVAHWFSHEYLFEEKVKQKLCKFLAVDNCITGKVLNDINVLTRYAPDDIDSLYLLELSHQFRLHHMNTLINQIAVRLEHKENAESPSIDTINVETPYSPSVKPLLSETFSQFKQGSKLELPRGFPYEYNYPLLLESLAVERKEEKEDCETAGSKRLKVNSFLPILPLIPLKNLSLHQSKSGYVLVKEIGRGNWTALVFYILSI